MKSIEELFKYALRIKASDIHLSVGSPPIFRIDGELNFTNMELLTPEDTLRYVKSIMSEKEYRDYLEQGESDFSYEIEDIGRFRANVFKKRGHDALVLRTINIEIPTLDLLGLPDVIKGLTFKSRGLILVTGTTGSGKSTTLAAMINEINSRRKCHILSIEDPVEYIHENNKSLISQRELGKDTYNYAKALRAALREDPDVILIGEMRDYETISIAITAAETGHLVLSTLHTMGAVKTIDRIISVFPSENQSQIRVQLSSVLEGVISQQLIPCTTGGRVPAVEIMVANSAVRNLIREGKDHQIESILQIGAKEGMITMDASITKLYDKGFISKENAVGFAVNKDSLNIF